jgi:hypothetical protein
MSIDGGVTPEQAIGANDASFDLLARLHDRKQRDHAAHWKIDPLDRLPRLVQHDTRSKVHQGEPRLHALEFVSRKLPQNAVLYEVLGMHMPASVAPSVGQRPRHGWKDAPNSVCCGDLGLTYPPIGGFHNYSRYRTDAKESISYELASDTNTIGGSHGRAHDYVPEHWTTNFHRHRD